MIPGNHFEIDPERNAKPIPKLIQKLIQKDSSSAPESEWDSELDSELGRNRGRNCTRFGFRIEADLESESYQRWVHPRIKNEYMS